MANYMYMHNSNGMPQGPPKAPQACATCKKQKRKCDKGLPKCGLCKRMDRECDYSDAPQNTTNNDLNLMQQQIADLKARLDAQSGMGAHSGMGRSPSVGMGMEGGGMSPAHAAYGTPSSNLSGTEVGLAAYGYNNIQVPDYHPLPSIPNRFPALAFLDGDAFKHGGIVIPKPSLQIPDDVLAHLGEGSDVQNILRYYFSTIHKWFPVVSQKRLMRNLENPNWQAGPDLALLFLCMKLLSTTPTENCEFSQLPIYLCAKRFVYMMEASGTISLLVLQAALLIVWYEYGQAIYPAAWMSAGWCVRYGNLLGINGNSSSSELLGRIGTWTEQEERRRTWWGVLVTDRIVSLGSQGYILSSQEPDSDNPLPVNDDAWDEGEMTNAIQRSVSTAVSIPVGPFPRLCQASLILGTMLTHHHGTDASLDEHTRFSRATVLYASVQELIVQLSLDSEASLLPLAAPLALAFSALCALCQPYSSLSDCNASGSDDSAQMIRKAVDGLNDAAINIVEFADRLNKSTPDDHDLDKVSPIVMNSIYSAASNFAWSVRESGAQDRLDKLNILRACLKRFGTRWRNASEYLRILEAQEFTYAVRPS